MGLHSCPSVHDASLRSRLGLRWVCIRAPPCTTHLSAAHWHAPARHGALCVLLGSSNGPQVTALQSGLVCSTSTSICNPP
eukprot:365939-Chlamydomonas_euryale.AAC.12